MCPRYLLIHSPGPQARPVLIIIFTCVVRPHFSKSCQTKQILVEIMFAIGATGRVDHL